MKRQFAVVVVAVFSLLVWASAASATRGRTQWVARFRARGAAVERRWRDRAACLSIVGLVTLMLVAACGTDDETAAEPPPAPPAETVPPTTAASEEPAAEGSVGVELAEENGSGQAGTATVTPSAEAVGVSVEVESADVAQLALVARGNCAALEEPFATIEGTEPELTGGTKSGHFETAELTILADGSPATLIDLQQGEFAILVIDATYRGGVVEEIPPDVQVFQGPDPEGPFGETAYSIAACGDVPAIG